MKKPWQPLLIGLLLLGGCATDPLPPGGGGDGTDPTLIGADAGTECAHPEEGCACDAEQPPIDCYLEATVNEDGSMSCNRGTRYCRGGAWTGCESITSYSLRSGPGIAALVTGPSECNPCDPACAVSRDIPSSADLPGHSSGVEYDPSRGGIAIMPDTTGTPPLPDSDGDGVPDVADDCVGPGVVGPPCSGSDTVFFHELPYGGTAEIDPLDISVQVRTADIYFLMDTTGSMGGEISRLKADLTAGTFIPGCAGGIIGAIRCTIPDAWFGVGQHDDYPVSPYGSAGSGDRVLTHRQDITASVSAAQTAVNALALHYGMDGPESQSQALWALATGGGLGPYLSAKTCSGTNWGYPCFRAGTIPVVVLFTDAPFHNGPYGYNYSFGGAASLPTTTAVSGNNTIGSARYTGDAATTWTGWTGYSCSGGNNFAAGCYYNYSADVWFRFTVSATRTITLSLEGSSYDTGLSITNSGGGEIACNDDAVGLQSRITATLGPGTYYAVVQGYAGSCGNYRLSIGNPSAGTVTTGYPVSWGDAVTALNARGIRVITVHSGGTYGIDDANALADATGSYSSSGARYVFPIASNGSGLSGAVVNAVVDLANYNRMDITARAVDNTATALDERGFVQSITAASWGPGSCSGISGGSTFVQCLPGTSVDFNIAFQNDIVMPSAVPQVFTFWIEVVGDGTFVLASIPVRIVVPPNVPLYPPSASYWRDYDADLFCASTERPDWSSLVWAATIPAGTSIRFEARTGNTAAEAAAATPVSFTAPPSTSPQDIGNRLVAAGMPNYLPYLRITAVLLSNTARTQTPVLSSFELRYTCTPME
jgi:hypothetical protein